MSIATMTLPELTARVASPVDETDLAAILARAAEIAAGCDRSLCLLCHVLAEEPPEVASGWRPAIVVLSTHLHPDTDGPQIAIVVARALRWFRCDGCGLESTHAVTDPTAEGRSVKPGSWCDDCDPGAAPMPLGTYEAQS